MKNITCLLVLLKYRENGWGSPEVRCGPASAVVDPDWDEKDGIPANGRGSLEKTYSAVLISASYGSRGRRNLRGYISSLIHEDRPDSLFQFYL